MNYKSIFRTLGTILYIEAGLMVPSVIVALIYAEPIWCFIQAMIVVLFAGLVLRLLSVKSAQQIYAKEGFAIVALSWVFLSLGGCLPFIFSGSIPDFFAAFFETVSGFTTTGASVVENVEALRYSILFWRSFTHWVGGMGVLVFMMAILPMGNLRTVHLMRAEVPGPTKGKLVPRMKSTAKILYGIYAALTFIEVIFLLCGGMSLFDALVHSFGTAGTGGFGIKAASVGAYNSAYIEIVISVFMLLFGINFNLYFFLLLRNFKAVYKNEELHFYLIVVAVATVAIALNILSTVGNFAVALRQAFFQVSSLVTTTGYSSVDFQMWPMFSKMILVAIMFMGSCAGSTAGGIKLSRIIIAYKSVRRELHRLLHPREIEVIHLSGEPVEEETVRGTNIFIVGYFIILIISTILVSLNGYDLVTSSTAVVSCLSNIGPGLNLVGPMGNFNIFFWPIKLLLSFDMLLGRLEIFPILMLFAPSAWKRR